MCVACGRRRVMSESSKRIAPLYQITLDVTIYPRGKKGGNAFLWWAFEFTVITSNSLVVWDSK